MFSWLEYMPVTHGVDGFESRTHRENTDYQ